MSEHKSKTLLIYGPTATGKTDLAIKLAKKYNGELISADSRQVYKDLDIGTGKVSFDSKVEKHSGYWIVDGVKINGFDIAKTGEDFTLYNFLKFAKSTAKKIKAKGKVPIIVGGTGFYVNSFLKGVDLIGVSRNPELRSMLEKHSREELYQKLMVIDKKRAQSMNKSDRLNPRRLIRAIEIAMTNKKSSKNPDYQPLTADYLLIGLTAPNSFIFDKVDKWLDKRVRKGLIEEVSALIDKGISPVWLENLGLEYKWITRLVLKKASKTESIKRLKGSIHSFVRRQKTWMNKFDNIKTYNVSKKNWQQKLQKDVEIWFKGSAKTTF